MVRKIFFGFLSLVVIYIILLHSFKKNTTKVTNTTDTISYIITNANGILFYTNKIDSINTNCIGFKYGKFRYRVCGSYTIQEQISK